MTSTDRDPVPLRTALATWFTPPRAHGEVVEDRTVSFIELFYDLVFVVLIGQLAHTLAEDVSPPAVVDFTVLFALVWIAWFNGSLYHDLHGREDGRSRSYIFAQMLVLVVVAVFAGDAAGDGVARSACRTPCCCWSWRGSGSRSAHRTATPGSSR
jgi:hypothetical protein